MQQSRVSIGWSLPTDYNLKYTLDLNESFLKHFLFEHKILNDKILEILILNVETGTQQHMYLSIN